LAKSAGESLSSLCVDFSTIKFCVFRIKNLNISDSLDQLQLNTQNIKIRSTPVISVMV